MQPWPLFALLALAGLQFTLAFTPAVSNSECDACCLSGLCGELGRAQLHCCAAAQTARGSTCCLGGTLCVDESTKLKSPKSFQCRAPDAAGEALQPLGSTKAEKVFNYIPWILGGIGLVIAGVSIAALCFICGKRAALAAKSQERAPLFAARGIPEQYGSSYANQQPPPGQCPSCPPPQVEYASPRFERPPHFAAQEEAGLAGSAGFGAGLAVGAFGARLAAEATPEVPARPPAPGPGAVSPASLGAAGTLSPPGLTAAGLSPPAALAASRAAGGLDSPAALAASRAAAGLSPAAEIQPPQQPAALRPMGAKAGPELDSADEEDEEDEEDDGEEEEEDDADADLDDDVDEDEEDDSDGR